LILIRLVIFIWLGLGDLFLALQKAAGQACATGGR
jgi:hypothetical protein